MQPTHAREALPQMMLLTDLPPLVLASIFSGSAFGCPTHAALYARSLCKATRDVADSCRGLVRISTPLPLWVIQRGLLNGQLLCGAASACLARSGVLANLRWAREQGCPWDARTCSRAAEGGHLAVLQWARENGCPWGEWTCARAAQGGHLAVLQWAREHGCPWDTLTCAYAAEGGHLAVLQWAREQGCGQP